MGVKIKFRKTYVKEIFFPIANPLPYFYNIHIPYIQMQHIKKGDFQWTLFQKFLRLSQATDKRHSTRSELRTIINVYWLDDPNKPFWDYSSDSLGAWFGIFTILFPWIGAILIIQLLGGADAIAQYNNSRM